MTDSNPPDELPSSIDQHGLWRYQGDSAGLPEGLGATSSLVDTRLGPFEVHDVIGQGAMGVVLSGVHVEQRVPVAIKAITDEASEDPRFRKLLRDEVQAVAQLHHPSIITLFDYGETDASTARVTEGAVGEGRPYFVMEQVGYGTLEDVIGRVRWSQVKAILLTILDALAHAHANDVIHRDVKPANILLAKWGGRIIPKVADFGIAFAMEGGSPHDASVGTPRYMAPEQIKQPWRKHGPWSDLFSLGCVAYELLTGEHFFDADGTEEVYRQHFRPIHPQLDPVVEVPDGFQEWLDTVLERSPGRRFQSAADAAVALAGLEGVSGRPADEVTELEFGRLTPVLDPVLPGGESGGSSPGVEIDESVGAELPDSWPQPTIEPHSIRVVGAGLNLYELRSIPLVGRDPELDRMWRTFRKVDEKEESRLLTVHGSQGCGKSRLVDWFTQRLEEFGAATVLRATHSAEGGQSDGLSGMLARHFRTLGADQRETSQLVHEKMGEAVENSPYELETMMQIVQSASTGDQGDNNIQIATPSQRYAVIGRYLRHRSRQRPVVLVCDDVHWGSDTLEFVRFLRRQPDDEVGPVLVLFVATDEALANRGEEHQLLETLEEQPGAQQLELEPLDPVHHERLVDELLALEGDLVRDVVRKTAGNPLFAVELIGDWVQRGVLEVGERGFVLSEGVEPTIPDHLHAMWEQRIEAVLSDYSDNPREAGDLREALQLAAALGQDVRTDEWRALCRLVGIPFDEQFAAELTQRRFARRTENGWAFAHAILHESVERLSREEEKWQRHRHYCASLVEQVYDLEQPRVAERFGRYALSAGDYDRALDPLMRGARRRRRRGEYRSTLQLLSDYIEALEGAEVPTEDARWGAAWVARSRTYLNDDNPKEARRWAERAREAADRHGWEVIESQAMGWLGLAKQWLGEQDALETLEGAFRLLEEVATEGRMRGAYGSVAHGLTSLREFEKAERLLELDHREAQRHSDERAVANNYNLRCRLAFFRQDFDAALEYAKRALSLFTAVGHLPGAATCQETMAEIQRRKGNLKRAETIYHKCIELQEAIGFRQAIAQMNLASLLLNRGEVDEAEKRFVRAASAFDESGRRSFHAVAVAGLLACASCQGWWNSIEEHLETIRAFVEKTDECERDLAEHLERAGDDLTEAERYEYAYEAYDLAYTQWERIGDEERIEAVAAKLAKWV